MVCPGMMPIWFSGQLIWHVTSYLWQMTAGPNPKKGHFPFRGKEPTDTWALLEGSVLASSSMSPS